MDWVQLKLEIGYKSYYRILKQILIRFFILALISINKRNLFYSIKTKASDYQ